MSILLDPNVLSNASKEDLDGIAFDILSTIDQLRAAINEDRGYPMSPSESEFLNRQLDTAQSFAARIGK